MPESDVRVYSKRPSLSVSCFAVLFLALAVTVLMAFSVPRLLASDSPLGIAVVLAPAVLMVVLWFLTRLEIRVSSTGGETRTFAASMKMLGVRVVHREWAGIVSARIEEAPLGMTGAEPHTVVMGRFGDGHEEAIIDHPNRDFSWFSFRDTDFKRIQSVLEGERAE